MNVKGLLKGVIKGTKDNLPVICTGVAVVGTWATAVSTGAATLKAKEHLDELYAARRANGITEPLTWWETVKECARYYILPVGFGTITTGANVMGLKAGQEQNMALASLAGLAQDSMANYAEKVVETIGEKKEAEIRDKVNQDQGRKALEAKCDGKTPFELIEGREYFVVDIPTQQVGKGTSNAILAAENATNRKIFGRIEGEATLEDFFEELGDPDHFKCNNALCRYPNGWNQDHPLKVTITVDSWMGIPAYYINYKIWNLQTKTLVNPTD